MDILNFISSVKGKRRVTSLKVTAEWGSANVADSIYSEIFTLTKTYSLCQ